MSDVTWWKRDSEGRNLDEPDSEPGKPDISRSEDVVGPSEEDVADVAHDDTEDVSDEPAVVTDQPDPNDPDLPDEVSDR